MLADMSASLGVSGITSPMAGPLKAMETLSGSWMITFLEGVLCIFDVVSAALSLSALLTEAY